MPDRRPDLSKWLARRLTTRRAHPRLVRAGSRLHLRLYRLFRGNPLAGADILILTTRGRTTGRPRSTPLNYIERDGTRYVAASFAGNDTAPQWYLNLRADPTVDVQVGSRRTSHAARVLPDDEAAAVWPELIAMDSLFAVYRARTARQIPVIELTPRPDAQRPDEAPSSNP